MKIQKIKERNKNVTGRKQKQNLSEKRSQKENTERKTNRQTDRPRDTNRQTNQQTDSQKENSERKTNRQTDKSRLTKKAVQPFTFTTFNPDQSHRKFSQKTKKLPNFRNILQN